MPITASTVLQDSNIAINQGLIFDDNFIYYIDVINGLRRIATSGGSPETIFTDVGINPVITAIFNNQLYYISEDVTETLNLNRIDLSNPVDILLVSLEQLGGFAQSSFLDSNQLYVGFKSAGDDPIVRFDLAQQIALQPETIIEDANSAALGITGYLNDLYYTDQIPQGIFILEDGLLSTTEFERITFEVFPNPTTDHVFIATENPEALQYEVFDILGKQVLNDSYAPTEGIDLSALINGIYFARITSPTEISSTHKIVKQ